MNLNLIDFSSSLQEFPDIIEDCLQDEFYIITCRFNAQGNLLAAGTSTGHLVIFDIITRSVAFSKRLHAMPIGSVCWSSKIDHCSQYILTASLDWTCSIIDITTRSHFSIKFNSIVTSAEFLPCLDGFKVLASVANDFPCILELDSCGSLRAKTILSPSLLGDYPDLYNSLAFAGRNFESIYLVSSKGQLYSILLCDSLSVKQVIKISNAAVITALVSPNGNHILINSTDRVLRLFSTKDLVLVQKYQDSINRIQWNACNFSSSGEYIVAGSTQNHNLYIYDTHSSTLRKILEGPKDGIEDLCWHPTRTMVTSVSSFGCIYVWSQTLEENWSAFAPDFRELERNVEYMEKETEFDVVDSDDEQVQVEEEAEIDILEGMDLQIDCAVAVSLADIKAAEEFQPIIQPLKSKKGPKKKKS